MLHIVLLILKIIGIILGALLAVLLIGLCIALFVPVRYQIEAGRTEAEGAPPIEASVKITWLLHLINIRIRYPADVYLRVRIFLFTIFRLPQERKKERGRKVSGKKKNDKEEAAGKRNRNDAENEHGRSQEVESGRNAESSQSVEGGRNAESSQSLEDVGKAASVRSEAQKSTAAESIQKLESVQEPGHEKQKIPFLKKLKKKLVQIRRIFQKIWYTLTGICDKIKTIWENIEYYTDILRSDTFKQAFSLCKDELFSIFSYIRPRKFQADLTVGMDDPAATGKILSYYGMLYPFIGSCVNVIPDFERKRMEGTVFIKGKIRLFNFIKAALRIYFNKDIRKLLKLFKKEDL
ncbi:MAG: DUF2953 domain-containing protein [Lachnospiraceae bacterium]|nr:DUF2953 domain-containing protein [Lachnospiraceae bacterium]